MPRLLVTGANSEMCRQLKPLVPSWCEWSELSRDECDMRGLAGVDCYKEKFIAANRLVIAHGAISPEPFLTRSVFDLQMSLTVNMLSVVRICEIALQHNPAARIVVLGSESATKGSHDVAYWLAKAALHSYVRERRLEHVGQQLVCVAPSAISDTGMTRQKTQDEIALAAHYSPHQRLATPQEIARLIHFLLFVDEGYITNAVVDVNGGKFARKSKLA
jgi:NAD(P)-dependent dehydrogenase (short-subunit alcohol dehydrogenase family)